MLRKLLFGLATLAATTLGETIVLDSFGHSVTLPLGSNSENNITSLDTAFSISPYTVRVYINDGQDNHHGDAPEIPNEHESFFFASPGSNGLYGNATLVSSDYTTFDTNATPQVASPVTQFLGTSASHMVNPGQYRFTFDVPPTGNVQLTIMYYNPDTQPRYNVIEQVNIFIVNPASVVGDPQFVGLRGQSYQVHGIDGAVYNIITDKDMQVNAKFVFLTDGVCPMIDGVADANCWSHPGSYLGEMSFQQIVEGQLHQVHVVSGAAKDGFQSIILDGKALSVGDSFSFGTFSVSMDGTHRASIQTELYSFELSNSDMFINQAVTTRVPLSKLTSHGLLGQTHAAKVYPGATRYIEGEVDDYVIADNDIFGTEFSFNKFHL